MNWKIIVTGILAILNIALTAVNLYNGDNVTAGMTAFAALFMIMLLPTHWQSRSIL